MRGIDVSSWQGDIQAQNLPVDFVIVKATEATNYVNPYCDPVITRLRGVKKWGFYHFAQNSSNPIDEARFFIDQTRNYFGEGIPVLDWEGEQSVNWVNAFVSQVHAETGVWPWVYANPWRFNQRGVDQNCGRWIASYPNVSRPGLDFDPGEVPETDGLVCCWQYASDGDVPGYDGNLDINQFFGDAAAWDAYVGVKAPPSPAPEPESPAQESVLENDDYKVEITRKK